MRIVTKEFTFADGLNSDSNPKKIGLNQVTVCRNVELANADQFGKRKGYSELAAVSSTGTHMGAYRYLLQDGTEYGVVGYSDGKIYEVKAGESSFNDRTPTGSTYSTTTTDRWEFCTFNDLLFGCEGTNFIKWDGSTRTNKTATVSGSPPGNIMDIENWKNRVWAIVENSDAIYWSELNDGQDWDTSNRCEHVGQGYKEQYNVAVKAGRNTLYVWKEDTTHALMPASNIRTVTGTTAVLSSDNVVLDKGCYAKKSLVKSPYGFIWLDPLANIYLWNERDYPQLISEAIRPDLQTCNYGVLKRATAIWVAERNQYWISVPYGSGQTTNNRTYVATFQETAQGLSIKWAWYDIPANDFLFLTTAGKQELHFVTSATSGEMFEALTGYNDDTAAIETTLKSKWISARDYGAEAHTAYLKFIKVTVSAEGNWNLNVGAEKNFEGTPTLLYPINQYTGGFIIGTDRIGVDTIGGGENEVFHTKKIKGKKFEHLRVWVENKNADEYFEVKSIEIGIIPCYKE